MIAKGRNGPRLSSAVLEPSSQDVDPYGGLSVDLEALMLTDGVDPAQPVGTAHSVGAIVLAVSAFRSRHFLVGYDPLPENPYHGAVWENAARSAKLTRGTKRALLKEAAWLVALPGVAISEG